MSTSPTAAPSRRPILRFRSPPREQASPEGLDDLRRLLLGPELERLSQLERKLSTDGLGKVLPGAAVASQRQGEELAVALSPAVVAAIHDAARKQPQLFVDAMVPVMGPAIRRSITTALRTLVQQLNETLASGLSPRALRWRWEAARTGRPFAEIVLLRSLVYRVEQLFLVHRESGLVLRHLVAPGSSTQDPDQVAAMLTAIDAFVHDAFREDARLEGFHVGELVGWVEHGPLAVLVAVVRGTAPDGYAEVLREASEQIHLLLSDELATFDGDVDVFVRAEPLLESCLRAEAVRPPSKPPRFSYVALALAALCAAALALGGIHVRRARAEQQRFDAFVAALAREPGVVVTRATSDGGRYAFEGLADPLAASPREIFDRSELHRAPASFRFAPFYSLDPRLAERRARDALKPPPTVTLAMGPSGVLTVSGTAPRGWVEGARLVATALPGITAVDTSGVVASGGRGQIERVRALLAGVPIFFAPDSTDLDRDGDARASLSAAAAAIREVLASAEGARAAVDVVGHADGHGLELRNRSLSEDRAERVASELSALGVPRSALHVRGAGVLDFFDDVSCADGRRRGDACARRVDLRLDLESTHDRGREP